MPVTAAVPDALARRIESLVQAGEYASFQSAVEDLLRRALAQHDRAPVPPPPPPPPGTHREPSDDRPIDVNPGRDVNWVGGPGWQGC